MAVRRRRRGTLFGDEELVLGGDPEDFKDTVKAHNAAKGWAFEGKIAGIADHCERLLEEVPSALDAIGMERVDRIAATLRWTKVAISKGDPERAALLGYELGILVKEHELSIHERAAISGHKVIDGGRRAVDQAHGTEADRLQTSLRIYREYVERRTELQQAGVRGPNGKAQEMLADSEGLSSRQIRTHIARARGYDA